MVTRETQKYSAVLSKGKEKWAGVVRDKNE